MHSSKPAKQASSTNQIRINAGVWRSRIIKFPDAEGLRPTPDRVRQTLFNWLGQDLTGKTCLDLFAGTGALGFEALSRNAKSVTMVENASIAYKALKQNEALLKPQNCQILQQDALQFLAQNKQQFDVIFCDPPYNKGWFGGVSPSPLPSPLKGEGILLLLNAHLAEGGMVYAEAEFELENTESWHVQKRGKAGAVYYHLLKSTLK